MPKLKQLINELCPDGVEFKPFGLVTEMKRGTSVTKKNLKQGKIPVISGGKEPAFYCDRSNRDGEIITVAGSGAGAGYVQYWNTPVFVNDAFSIKGNEKLLTKYIYYYLCNIQDKIYATKKGGGIPHVHISSIENFLIPVPPIEVQCEIVRILDNFTELTQELTQELTLRKKQYQYYRDYLLDFGDDVEYKALNEITTLSRGVRVVRNQLETTGTIPVYQNSLTPLGYYTKSNCKANTTFIIGAGNAGEIGFSYVDFWSADDCYYFICSEKILDRFLYYALLCKYDFIKLQVRKASIPRISRNVIEKIKIPVPPIEEQERIVKILDKFDTLCNDLTNGIPAEIALRKKQYEYYRDKLLTFREI
ncbi:MAG: restriction endonuclease subunit S [Ruminococcus sp.]|nr:restriction endonuclease subunit S [Ruminococcus sp.]